MHRLCTALSLLLIDLPTTPLTSISSLCLFLPFFQIVFLPRCSSFSSYRSYSVLCMQSSVSVSRLQQPSPVSREEVPPSHEQDEQPISREDAHEVRRHTISFFLLLLCLCLLSYLRWTDVMHADSSPRLPLLLRLKSS